MRRPIQRFATLNGVLLAAGISILALATLVGLSTGTLSSPVSSAPRLQAPSPCTVESSTVLESTEIGVKDTVGITFTAKSTCPADGLGPLHIVFVMQASSPMARDPDTGEHPQAEMKAAAKQVVESLGLADNPWIKVGIVEYGDGSNQLCALTNNVGEVLDCISRVKSSGETNLVRGVEGGLTTLERGRRAAPPSLGEVMLLFGDMSNDFSDPRTSPAAVDGVAAPRQAGCDPVIEAVDEIKAESPNMVIGTVCVGGCDLTCARRIATSSGYLFNTDRIDQLITSLGRIVESVRGTPVKSLTVDITLNDAMGYVADSAMPGATVEVRHVIWEVRGTGALDAVLRVRLEPLVPGGVVAACAAAEGLLVDSADRELTFALECPEITIREEEATSTPTIGPTEPPSDTPDPSTPETPETPDPGESPTAEPTPEGGHKIFMPIAHDGLAG